ncbi:XRE family transcriptional regulator [Arthrobacter sp. H5]|uniref:XRE family transcriptional regulator n=1 Tax=Arthrobacter sp. H5 TaxID=1267973 RepID=UPI0004B5C7FE|nr:XRE family transcriptional regulator [Arthrobacter sp. H5]
MLIAPGRDGQDGISAVVQWLCGVLTTRLTTRLVGGLAGITDMKLVGSWRGGGREPEPAVEERLRFAYGTLRNIEAARGRRGAQAWSMTMNPRLNGCSPIKAIREGRYPETATAAEALLEDGYNG